MENVIHNNKAVEICNNCLKNPVDMKSIVVCDWNGKVYEIEYCPCYSKKYETFVSLFKEMGFLK